MKPRSLATLLTLILALALGASGPLRAFAHGFDGGVVAMVICGDEGTKTVYLDAVGRAVDPAKARFAHSCDACMPSGMAADLPTLPVPPVLARRMALAPEAIQPSTRSTRPTWAGGPPAGDELA